MSKETDAGFEPGALERAARSFEDGSLGYPVAGEEAPATSRAPMPLEQQIELADQLAAMRAPMEDGRMVVSKAGRAFLAGAEAALRATSS